MIQKIMMAETQIVKLKMDGNDHQKTPQPEIYYEGMVRQFLNSFRRNKY